MRGIEGKLGALNFARKNRIPVLVFDFQREENIRRAVAGEPLGTMINAS